MKLRQHDHPIYAFIYTNKKRVLMGNTIFEIPEFFKDFVVSPVLFQEIIFEIPAPAKFPEFQNGQTQAPDKTESFRPQSKPGRLLLLINPGVISALTCNQCFINMRLVFSHEIWRLCMEIWIKRCFRSSKPHLNLMINTTIICTSQYVHNKWIDSILNVSM